MSIQRGEESTCSIIQIFTKNATQWKAKPLEENEINLFKEVWKKSKIKLVLAHDSYLIHLASPDETTFKKSYDAFLLEMKRTEALGIHYLIMHPGSHLGNGESNAIKRVGDAFNKLMEETPNYELKVLIETTAGQGSNIGYKFEHLRDIISIVKDKDRIGTCFDTCHVFGAGYDIRTEETFSHTLLEFDNIIGLDKLFAFHLNDSKNKLGSRVDRHEHIGKGQIGLETFSFLMNHEKFKKHPMSIETPKEDGMDIENLKVLRSLRKA